VSPPAAAPGAHAAAARGRVPQAFPGRSEERSDAPPAQQHPRIEEQGRPEAVREPRRHEPAVDEPPVTREPLEAAKEDQPGEPEPEPTFSTPTSARHPASSKLEIRPGTKEWDAAVKDLREADDGKGRDYRVGSLEEALQLLRAARGHIEGHGRYGEFEPPGSKRGYELHTNENYPESRSPWNDLPHVKWEDWQTGEKGAYGHIFYPDPHRLF
jgi:hypothetical protein